VLSHLLASLTSQAERCLPEAVTTARMNTTPRRRRTALARSDPPHEELPLA
jgi:hypothetical protein